MFAKTITRIYLTGVCISSLHCLYKYNEDIGCKQCFGSDILQGITWPITITNKVTNFIQNIDVISKNN
jgi:hypothetical protein